MKKLSLKQRMRQPKPRRKTPRRASSVVVTRSPSIDGYVVRLPAEPHPNKPEHPPIPVYVGWGGRALHIRQALIFGNQDDAARAAAGFPDISIEPCDLHDDAPGMDPWAWMKIAVPDPIERKRAIGRDLAYSPEVQKPLGELQDQLFASLLIPDSRAPQDEALKSQVIETMLTDAPVNIQFLLPDYEQ